MITFEKNGITFHVESQVDHWGHQRVTAEFDGQSTHGELPGIKSRAYPRIEFNWGAVTDWLRKHADHQGHIIDEYDEMDEVKGRPTDSVTIDIPPDVLALINADRVVTFEQKQTQAAAVQREYAEPIFGIGALNRGDGAEIHVTASPFSPRKSSGKLWQPCAKRGCDAEPVCIDCEYCDLHCHCGE